MKFLYLIITITITVVESKAQPIDLKGFDLGKSWEYCTNLIRRNYPNSFHINPNNNSMSFNEGILPPLTSTYIKFKNNKVYEITSTSSFITNTTRWATNAEAWSGSPQFIKKDEKTIQWEYQTNTNSAAQKFRQCYSILESKYGSPIHTSELPEAMWNIGNIIVRLYATLTDMSWFIKVEYKEGCINIPNNKTNSTSSYIASGSGIILTTNGIIATNHHVIEGASVIDIQLTRNGEVKTYKSKVLVDDKTNDLALLKIEDASFQNFSSIPYALKTSICNVGTSVFTMGYPMSNYLGEEVKITDGLISSKTGYQGDIATYQISVPIQHGNSGGPLFDKQGNLVGITNAGIPEADNVGYAIKASYLRNLIDASPIPINIPSNNNIANLSFTEKIKSLSSYIVHIKIK